MGFGVNRSSNRGDEKDSEADVSVTDKVALAPGGRLVLSVM